MLVFGYALKYNSLKILIHANNVFVVFQIPINIMFAHSNSKFKKIHRLEVKKQQTFFYKKKTQLQKYYEIITEQLLCSTIYIVWISLNFSYSFINCQFMMLLHLFPPFVRELT
jgi:hypothetical protein